MPSAQAKTDVHVVLAPGETGSNVIEIVIGGWNNGQSVIRRGKQGTSISSYAKVKKNIDILPQCKSIF